ncbi:RDD family protein [Sedimenticola thiotaurini]|uniref:Transporter n=1 Tax=Sedimenticola thiotaurini TaxID=1543721 RepID=A0A0F7JXZ3_9GAMM|nr:RDD family protein [Sedimenticola thiotaurini]AKH20562.1 transporter [Sedimenticola thiotaurini]
MLDTIRSYETPEGVALSLRLAGPVVRSCAWAIDMLIRAGLYLAIAIPFSFLGGLGFGLSLVLFFLIEWFYPVLFEMRQGATPGKKAMGLEVIQDNGTPVSWSASLIRNLLRAADFLPFLYAAGLVSMLLNRNFQRLGDLAAGTLVVYRSRVVERPALPDVPPVHPPMQFVSEEKRSLLEFAERAPQLTQARRIELAEILTDLTNQRGEAAVHELLAYAGWLAQGQGR